MALSVARERSSSKRIDKFVGEIEEVLSDPALTDEIHHGEEEEGLVRCAMVCDLRVPLPASVGSKIFEHLDVFFKHHSERAPRAFICFCSLSTLDRMEKVIK